jgi:hypothetical protein
MQDLIYIFRIDKQAYSRDICLRVYGEHTLFRDV